MLPRCQEYDHSGGHDGAGQGLDGQPRQDHDGGRDGGVHGRHDGRCGDQEVRPCLQMAAYAQQVGCGDPPLVVVVAGAEVGPEVGAITR